MQLEILRRQAINELHNREAKERVGVLFVFVGILTDF